MVFEKLESGCLLLGPQRQGPAFFSSVFQQLRTQNGRSKITLKELQLLVWLSIEAPKLMRNVNDVGGVSPALARGGVGGRRVGATMSRVPGVTTPEGPPPAGPLSNREPGPEIPRAPCSRGRGKGASLRKPSSLSNRGSSRENPPSARLGEVMRSSHRSVGSSMRRNGRRYSGRGFSDGGAS